MSLEIIFGIIFIHWVADFVLQSHWMAANKSTSNAALSLHVYVYSMVWFFVGTALPLWQEVSMLFVTSFTLITFVCHWITDYFTSRLNSWLWKKGDIHNFFVSVGFDQVLHYAQLLLTYYFLKNIC